MQNRLLSQLALIARWVLAGIAAGFVIWAFARVGARTVRDVLAGDTRTEITVMHWAGGGGQEEDRIVADLIADFCAVMSVANLITPQGFPLSPRTGL